MTSTTDPDTGETKTWYDEADRPQRVTDAESRTTYTEHDELGRVEAVREGSATAVPVKAFTYDSLPGALGQPVASIRHTPNGDFVDPHTGRLQRTVADRETSGPHRISDGSYAYDKSGTITSHARQLTDTSGSSWDTQCFTYDVMGELLNARTSNVTPTGAGNGCKASNGATWGPARTTWPRPARWPTPPTRPRSPRKAPPTTSPPPSTGSATAPP